VKPFSEMEKRAAIDSTQKHQGIWVGGAWNILANTKPHTEAHITKKSKNASRTFKFQYCTSWWRVCLTTCWGLSRRMKALRILVYMFKCPFDDLLKKLKTFFGSIYKLCFFRDRHQIVLYTIKVKNYIFLLLFQWALFFRSFLQLFQRIEINIKFFIFIYPICFSEKIQIILMLLQTFNANSEETAKKYTFLYCLLCCC
jgi:hypothetical protein